MKHDEDELIIKQLLKPANKRRLAIPTKKRAPLYDQTITKVEYKYFLARGRLFQMFPECTGVYEDDKKLFIEEGE
jgi:hypothetical protein